MTRPLMIQISRVEIEFTRGGQLVPWMGPALRGLVAMAFRRAVCQQPANTLETTWRYCKGCPHMESCSYGQLIEPDPPEGLKRFTGQEDASRPVVIELPFPAPKEIRPGITADLTITVISSKVIGLVGELWEQIRRIGSQQREGLGRDSVLFRVVAGPKTILTEEVKLPLHPLDRPDLIREVHLKLVSPLFLRGRREDGSRFHIAEPTFSDFFRASLRTLGQFYSLYCGGIEADFAALKNASINVPTFHAEYEPFRQLHQSNRSGQRRELYGTLGEVTFGQVPAALLPWLVAGGMVGVGNDRNCGAGKWEVEVG